MSQAQAQKRIATRRGSVSAPDPFGKHASVNNDPHRSSSSRLTIVRVLDPSPASLSFAPALDLPSSPGLHHRRSRRHGSSSSFSTSDNRLSFALSSFAPTSPTQPSPNTQNPSARGGSSPTTSPRLRPSSPSFIRRLSASGPPAYSRPNLSPEQLVELARQSSNPRFVPQATVPASPVSPPSGVTPATFTPLPPDIYLPFIDRPGEVSTLLSTPPTTKLFSLLAQTFPKGTSEDQDFFTDDPSSWSFQTLRLWLTTVDRSVANDSLWVRNSRKCVLTHSELIWERLKGALGVPPELELEDDDLPYIDDAVLVNDADPLHSGKAAESAEEAAECYASPTAASPVPRSPSEDITIEPIIATPSSNSLSTFGSSNPPLLSLTASLSQSASINQVDGLQDIGEEVEEEENADNDPQEDSRPQEEETQIHGLSISTCPTSSSVPHTPHPFSHPSSPDVHSPVGDGHGAETHTKDLPPSLNRHRSRASSRSSVSSFMRPILGPSTHRDGELPSGFSDFGDNESEQGYDPVGDRSPGNPLFPSNFARLALGPTLRANNPSLRSSRVAAVCARFARWKPGGRPPSWIEGWDPVKHEYAATAASGSSVGVGGGE